MDTFLSLIKAWKQKGITKTHKMLKKKFESSFTFVTFKLFLNQKKFAHFQIGPQMVHNIDSKKNCFGRHKMGFLRNTQDLLYQQKSKSIPSPEENYSVHFALRYPVTKQYCIIFIHTLVGMQYHLPGFACFCL